MGSDCVPDFWRCQTAMGAVSGQQQVLPHWEWHLSWTSHLTIAPGEPPFLGSKMHRLGEDSWKQGRNSLSSAVMLPGIMRLSSISGEAWFFPGLTIDCVRVWVCVCDLQSLNSRFYTWRARWEIGSVGVWKKYFKIKVEMWIELECLFLNLLYSIF